MRSILFLALAVGCGDESKDTEDPTSPSTSSSITEPTGTNTEPTGTEPTGTEPTSTTTEPTGTTTTTTTTTDTALPGWPAACPAPGTTLTGETFAVTGTAGTVPTFDAINRDGSPRTEIDLRGQATVLWFYPAAGTGG